MAKNESWRAVTVVEMKTVFAVVIYMGLVKVICTKMGHLLKIFAVLILSIIIDSTLYYEICTFLSLDNWFTNI